MAINKAKSNLQIDRQSFQNDSCIGKTKAARIASRERIGYAQIKDFSWRDAIEKYSDYFIRY